MFLSKSRTSLVICSAVLALCACSQSNAVPSGTSGAVTPQTRIAAAAPDDSTSILKQDKKNVVIGSTVDTKNGDQGPHSIALVKINVAPLKKGELLVCNFEDSTGTAGNGTTLELLQSAPKSKPKRFAQSNDIKGCSGVAVSTQSDWVYGTGLTSGVLTPFTPKGAEQPTYGSPLEAPFSDVDVGCSQSASTCLYAAEYIFTSDAKTGSIVSAGINQIASGFYLQVATGFAVNNGTGLNVLGPSGLSFDPNKNLLYIADGVTNTVVKFTNPNEMLTQNEIIVSSNGRKFTCAHKQTTCGKLVKAGSPLNEPIAMCPLPNGNLLVANGAKAKGGGNELVEMTPKGTILDTEVVDKGSAPAIFGLVASGTKDSNTVIYYTDVNDNSVHEFGTLEAPTLKCERLEGLIAEIAIGNDRGAVCGPPDNYSAKQVLVGD